MNPGRQQGIQFRVATTADVAAMAKCRISDPTAGAADPRMAAYFEGRHHPHQALLPRTGFVALANDTVIGYIAGHLTTRHDCQGEVQYLFVTSECRRRGVATELLRLLAGWFREQAATRVCVCVDADSPAAKPFYASRGATAIKPFWYVWEEIGAVPGPAARG